MMSRVTAVSALLVTAMLMLGAALLIGRSLHAPMAVVRTQGDGIYRLAYSVIDLNRSLVHDSALTVPGLADARFYQWPPWILQRTNGSYTSGWTLSEFDALTEVLIPRMVLTTSTLANIQLGDIRERDTPGGPRLSLYVNYSGEIYGTDGSGIHPRLIATLEKDLHDLSNPANQRNRYWPNYPGNMFWSPDGTRFLVMGTDRVTIMNEDGSGEAGIETSGLYGMWPLWSPDAVHVLFFLQPSADENVPMPVYDAVTAAPMAELSGRMPYWCGERQVVYVRTADDGSTELRLADVGTGEDTLLIRDGFGRSPLIGARPVTEACDWFMIGGNASRERWLFNRTTGAQISIGTEVNLLETKDDTLLYQALVGNRYQVRRVTFEPTEHRSELLVEFKPFAPYAIAPHWIGDWRRGLVTYMVEPSRRSFGLTLIDVVQGTQTHLFESGAQEYYVIP